jgi:hypothetical protein
MALKNQNIAKANPSATVNANFVNALYQEKFGRDATVAELAKFANNYTVKDAANIILGAQISPFYSAPAPAAPVSPAPTNTPIQKATLSSPDGKYKTAVNVGSSEASKLQSKGWTVSNKGSSAIDTAAALNYSVPNTPAAPVSPAPVTENKVSEPATPAAENPAVTTTGAGNKVLVKDVNGNMITVYQSDIPKLFSEGTLPAGTSVEMTSVVIPDELTNNPYYQQLDDENKKIIDLYYQSLSSQNKTTQDSFINALTLASQQADSYWAEKINVVKDELERTLGTYDTDLAAKEKELLNRRANIEATLASDKEFLTADQAAELSKQVDDLNAELINIGDKMANAGLTSSSVRNIAEDRARKASQYVIGSIQRKNDKNLSDIERTANYNIADIEKQINDLRASTTAAKTSATRTAESVIGSSDVNKVAGAAPYSAGDLTGTLAEDKASDILKRTTGLFSTSGSNI